MTRDKIAACLWPDADEERARTNLSKGLYAVRRDLGSDDIMVRAKDLRLNRDVVAGAHWTRHRVFRGKLAPKQSQSLESERVPAIFFLGPGPGPVGALIFAAKRACCSAVSAAKRASRSTEDVPPLT